MSRQSAIERATGKLDSGELFETLSRRVAMPTESQNDERGPQMQQYLDDEMIPAFKAMGFSCQVLRHPKAGAPFLIAERIEGKDLPTVLGYGDRKSTR